MHKFPNIEQFRHVIKKVEFKTCFTDEVNPDGYPILLSKNEATLPVLGFHGTTKLHGTNAGVSRMPDGTLTPQSRTRALSTQSDNHQFAQYVEDVPTSVWERLFSEIFRASELQDCECTIFAEWCGKGIQKNVGIAKLDKMFVIIGAKSYDGDDSRWIPLSGINDPEICAIEHSIFNIFHFPTFEIEIDFLHPKKAADLMATLVKQVEDCCPVANHFGIQGLGEGIVWRCITPGWESSKFWFKTKGDKHKVTKERKKVPVDVEKAASVSEFITRTVTDARCEQSINDQNLELSRKSTGAFLRWMGQDVIKEESDTLEASGLTWKEVAGAVNKAAKDWFFARIDQEAGL